MLHNFEPTDVSKTLESTRYHLPPTRKISFCASRSNAWLGNRYTQEIWLWFGIQNIQQTYLYWWPVNVDCHSLFIHCLFLSFPAPGIAGWLQHPMRRAVTSHWFVNSFIMVVHEKFLPPATKLVQGYIFTGICHSVNRGVLPPGGCFLPGVLPPDGVLLRGWCLFPGGVCFQGGPGGEPPGMATAAGSTHPTGMHSCLVMLWTENYDWTYK